MKILYGVVGEGMGHATRSSVIVNHLASQGHEILIVVSGRAYKFLHDRFNYLPNVEIREIEGFSLSYEDNKLSLPKTIWKNVRAVPKQLTKNIGLYLELHKRHYEPDVVISDFDSWAHAFAMTHRVPFMSISNIQALSHLKHRNKIFKKTDIHYQVTRFFTKMKNPFADYYLIPSFFNSGVRHKNTIVTPLIIRDEILNAERKKGDHVVVYKTGSNEFNLKKYLQNFPMQFIIYGMNEEGEEENIIMRKFSGDEFVKDLSSAKAVIANAGFSLMSECIHLGIPMLALPIQRQFEQEMNARYLCNKGFGDWTYKLRAKDIERFFGTLNFYESRLQKYKRQDNQKTLKLVDRLIRELYRKGRYINAGGKKS